MTCDEVRELLSGYHDGELEASADRQVRAHLLACQACGEEAQVLSNLGRLLASLRECRPPTQLWERNHGRPLALLRPGRARAVWRRASRKPPSGSTPMDGGGGLGRNGDVFLVILARLSHLVCRAPTAAHSNGIWAGAWRVCPGTGRGQRGFRPFPGYAPGSRGLPR